MHDSLCVKESGAADRGGGTCGNRLGEGGRRENSHCTKIHALNDIYIYMTKCVYVNSVKDLFNLSHYSHYNLRIEGCENNFYDCTYSDLYWVLPGHVLPN